jgi:hypothetical protein
LGHSRSLCPASLLPCPCSLLPTPCILVQEGLQNQGGGYLVDDFAMVLAGVSGLVENLVGIAGGEPLIPHMDGESGKSPQVGGKSLGLERPRAHVAGEVERIADHDSHYAETAAETGQGAEVFARVVTPLQGEDRLRGQPELVGDGHADALGADVETEIAGVGGGFQFESPGFQLNAAGGGNIAFK